MSAQDVYDEAKIKKTGTNAMDVNFHNIDKDLMVVFRDICKAQSMTMKTAFIIFLRNVERVGRI